MKVRRVGASLVAIIAFLFILAQAQSARAHCDTMNGPVVTAARSAIEKGDATPVLKWVKKEHEQEVRTALALTLTVRKGGAEARDLADRYFFETVVRLHRAGEGAPYTGLKAADTSAAAAPIEQADDALSGSVDAFAGRLASHLVAGLRERHARVVSARAHADESVEAGRRYVAAYVDYVHYVEAVVNTVHGAAGHDHADAAPEPRGAATVSVRQSPAARQ
jgi:hypothetical protein